VEGVKECEVSINSDAEVYINEEFCGEIYFYPDTKEIVIRTTEKEFIFLLKE